MRLKKLEINGFKSFSKKTSLEFESPVVCIVGPNGSGKSNVVEAVRFVLGEQSMKSMRGKSGVDLIFKGSKSLPKGTKASVSVYFDNSDKVFKLLNDQGESVNLNFDTVSISREVYSDGLNKYILNGQEVRLKDIHGLLSSVNIGSSGHHIISQGEADRILNASPKDRKEMIEDALGLKIYQYKLREAERKLERTEDNMKEVSMLRRENVPHLNFLKKQVEKLEKAKEMKDELFALYQEYLKKEKNYLDNEKKNLEEKTLEISREIKIVADDISRMEGESNKEESKKIKDLRQAEQKLNEFRSLKGEMGRKLGRIEGMIEAEERRKERMAEFATVSPEEVKDAVEEIDRYVKEAITKDGLEEVKSILRKIQDALSRLTKREKSENESAFGEIESLKRTKDEITIELKEIEVKENVLAEEISFLKKEIDKEMESLRDQEREKFALKVKHQELTSRLGLIRVKEENLHREEESLKNEIKEGVALVGDELLLYENFPVEEEIDRSLQEEKKRKIERIKIKLEDAGLGGGPEVLKEYEEVTRRDQFLAKELEDLSASLESLKKIMADLKEKIDTEFKDGIKKISVEFQQFFSLMFGGGSGSLSIVVENKKKRNTSSEEDEEIIEDVDEEIIFEQGVEIDVSLPHKKVKELHALSGGERSLTSIALLFAMSQVNPPPFLILDETDAALDEANSRKYGDMIEKLSKESQLVVVTHNRETMSRAGVIYGVTVGGDGSSKLLSIKFEEAASIAK